DVGKVPEAVAYAEAALARARNEPALPPEAMFFYLRALAAALSVQGHEQREEALLEEALALQSLDKLAPTERLPVHASLAGAALGSTGAGSQGVPSGPSRARLAAGPARHHPDPPGAVRRSRRGDHRVDRDPGSLAFPGLLPRRRLQQPGTGARQCRTRCRGRTAHDPRL